MRKKLLIFVSCVFIITCYIKPTSAYVLSGYKLPGGATGYRWSSAISINYSSYKTAWNSAISNWKNSNGIGIFYISDSPNYLDVEYDSAASAYGHITYSTNIWKEVVRFHGYINRYLISSGTSTTAQSTATHELGHIIGLNDLRTGTAIMNTNRNRATIYKPQSDDVSGVKKIYN